MTKLSPAALASMSRIRKRKRALKRARAQVTVESVKVTGETIISAGMSPEREAEIRKQYYRDTEPKVAVRYSDTIKIGAPLRADEVKCACTEPADCVGIKRDVLIRKVEAVTAPATDITPEYLDKLRLDCLRATHNSMPGADPHAVVRAAAVGLEVKLRFLRGQSWPTMLCAAPETESGVIPHVSAGDYLQDLFFDLLVLFSNWSQSLAAQVRWSVSAAVLVILSRASTSPTASRATALSCSESCSTAWGLSGLNSK
jgi:hypothetical protein